MSVKVYVRNGNLEGAITAFKSKVSNAGILEQWKENQFYTKPSAKRREARKKAIRERKSKDA